VERFFDLQLFDTESISTAGDALRSYYLPGLRTQIDEHTSPLVAQIDRTSEGVSGKDVKMAMRYGRSGGVGFISDTGTLPTPYSRSTKQVTMTTKNAVAYILIYDKTIEASKSDAAAFANMLTANLKDAQVDAKEQYGRSFFGDGTGLITTVTTHTAEAITVASSKALYEGMAIDSYTSDTAHDEEMRITKVDRSTNIITVDAETDTENSDDIYVAGCKDNELTGFAAVFDSTKDIYGLTRADYPFLYPQELNVNGELEDPKIQEGLDLSEDVAGGTISILAAARGVYRAYASYVAASRHQNDTLDLKGGWKALSAMGIPMTSEKYMPSGTLFGFQLSDWKVYQMADWDWMDRDGAILKWIANTTSYGAVLRKYAELGCQCPAAQVRWYGITEH
jgi:hypothetical protein